MQVFFASWLVSSITLYIIARILPGINIQHLYTANSLITTQGAITCIIGGLVMGVFNAVLKPILNFFSLPLTCLTLGLFSFVVTGIVFYLAAMVIPHMQVASIWWAILGGMLFGIINSLISGLLGIRRDRED
ncbi:MAG: phage holin family protein [Candidatus Eremiobacteraeota bacterium]|nr:phage holin family protein [Candidatus Eremiobacteraeota bacterium]